MKIIILLWGIIALASNSVECCFTSGGTSGGGGGYRDGALCVDRCRLESPGDQAVDRAVDRTANTDAQCANYDHSRYGSVGSCVESSLCPNENYISNLCPTKPNCVKCCFSTPEAPCEGRGRYFRGSAQQMACQILNHRNIRLLSTHPSRVVDGADPKSNIRDTCAGRQAKRSSYGNAPGGHVSLKASVLAYILDVADCNKYDDKLQINSIAGASHSSNSKHYDGTAVDFQIKHGDACYYSGWKHICSAHGARENLGGRGDAGHSSHTHCGFSS